MNAEKSDAERVLYTVGHSNHAWETFLGLLQTHQIETLVDTRSRPHAAYTPHFNREEMRAALTSAGIRYVFLGEALGGRPEGREFYDLEGYVLYSRVAQSPKFLDAISKLERGVERGRIAMLCSEENPAGCHRRLLVGRVLAERGMTLLHIRGDGELQTEAEFEAKEKAAKGEAGQGSLFETEEVVAWKSLRPVLPRRPPNTFPKSDEFC